MSSDFQIPRYTCELPGLVGYVSWDYKNLEMGCRTKKKLAYLILKRIARTNWTGHVGLNSVANLLLPWIKALPIK